MTAPVFVHVPLEATDDMAHAGNDWCPGDNPNVSEIWEKMIEARPNPRPKKTSEGEHNG